MKNKILNSFMKGLLIIGGMFLLGTSSVYAVGNGDIYHQGIWGSSGSLPSLDPDTDRRFKIEFRSVNRYLNSMNYKNNTSYETPSGVDYIKNPPSISIGSGSSGKGNGSSSSGSGSSGSGSNNSGGSSGSNTGGGYSFMSFMDLTMGDETGLYKDENGYWVSYDDYVQVVDEKNKEVGIMYYKYMKMIDGGKDSLRKNNIDYRYSSHKYVDMYLYNVSDNLKHDELQSNLFLNKQPIPYLYEYDDSGKLKRKINLFTYSEYYYLPVSSTGVVEMESYEQIHEVASAHDYEDFSQVSSPDNWSLMFKIGRNCWNDSGSSYDSYNYPFSKSQIESMSEQTIKGGGTPFRNLKTVGQILGLGVLKNEKLWDKSAGIDSSSRMMFSTNEVLTAMQEKINTITIDEDSNFAEFCSLSALGVQTNDFHTMFLSVDGQWASPRWLWSASPGVQGSFTNYFSRDVTPEKSWDLKRYLNQWSGSSYKQNINTATAPDGVNVDFYGTGIGSTQNATKNGIKTYIVICQNYPEFMNLAFKKGIGTQYAKSIEELNLLAISDYQSWYSCVLEQAKWMYKYFAVSNYTTAAEGAIISIAKNSTYFANISVARALPVECEICIPQNDLLISNSKNETEKMDMLNTISWADNDSTNSYGLPTNNWDITSYVYNQNVGLDSENVINENYNSDTNKFATSLYIARVPSSLGLKEKTEVKLSDFNVVASVDFNNDSFDASKDVNKDGRKYINTSGLASDTFEFALGLFDSDFNSIYIKNSFKRGTDSKIYATPVRYKVPEGEVLDFSGTEKIKMSDWINVTSLDTLLPAGGIVEYKMDYTFPSSRDIENELSKKFGVSLYKKGDWWDSYNTVLSTNLNFDIVPKNDNGNKNNINYENDWTRMRIVKPKLRDMYISKVEIYRSDKAAPIITKTMGGSATGFCYLNEEGQRIEKITIPKSEIKDLQVNQNTGQYSAYLYAKVYYNYYGKNGVLPINNWAYLKVSNSFSKTETEINASLISGYTAINDGRNVSALQIDFNKADLNDSKDKMLSISVPVGDNNECRNDWEVINIVVEKDSYDKDNEVLDIQLTTTDGLTEFGDRDIYRGGHKNISQQIGNGDGFSNGINTSIIVTVKRNAPTDKAWDEARKDGSLDGALSLTYNKNGKVYTQTLLAPNLFGNYKWGEGKALGYSKTNQECFSRMGDIMYYKFDIGNDVKSLQATASFRTGENVPKESVDYEDYAILNNTWTEMWECVSNPDYELSIIDGQPNVIKQAAKNSNPQAENIKPYLNFTIAQLNENYIGSSNVFVHVYRTDGAIPESIDGISYMGNGKASVSFGSGATEPIECHAKFKEEEKSYYCNSANNKSYEIKAHINYLDCKTDPTEINYDNNYKSHTYTVNLSYDCSPDVSVTPPCLTGQLRNTDARTIYGLNQKYEWDTKFSWYQSSKNEYESVNVYVPHYTDGCPSKYEPEIDSEGNSHRVLVEYIEHEHCPCYCSPRTRGANDGKRYWRDRDLGLGLYYEYHDLRVYVWSSAHGLRDISSGSTVVYTGEKFKFYFESSYISNRGELPNAKHEPYGQPYSTGNGGSGCVTPCNVLSRSPGVRNVEGPSTVRIQISGTQGYNMDRIFYKSSDRCQIVTNEETNKVYRWTPIPGDIYVAKTNVNQRITLSIGSYDFKGYTYDTDDSADGSGTSRPGYAWYSRERHVFCGVRTGIIYIRPSKPYIGTAPGSSGTGLDSTINNGGGTPWADGDTWVQ